MTKHTSARGLFLSFRRRVKKTSEDSPNLKERKNRQSRHVFQVSESIHTINFPFITNTYVVIVHYLPGVDPVGGRGVIAPKR